MGNCREFCPVPHPRMRSLKAHRRLWGLDHPLSGPCSACDVHSCTGQVGKGSQKERRPWTKQCRDSFNPASSPPFFGHQAEPCGQRRPRVSPWQLTVIQGIMLPWNGSYLDQDHQPACWEQCPSLSSVPCCTGVSLGSHHALFLYLRAVCNETCIFSTLLWWDPAWKLVVLWLPVPLAHLQSLPHQKVKKGLFWTGAMRQTGLVHHCPRFHFSSCVEHEETKLKLSSSGSLNSVELHVLLALLVCYGKTTLWFLVWKWR